MAVAAAAVIDDALADDMDVIADAAGANGSFAEFLVFDRAGLRRADRHFDAGGRKIRRRFAGDGGVRDLFGCAVRPVIDFLGTRQVGVIALDTGGDQATDDLREILRALVR